MQLAERFTQMREGVCHLPHAGHVATRQGRPHLLGGFDAFARLGQHQWVEAAELLDCVVDVLLGFEVPSGPHGAQGQGFVTGSGYGLRAEEQQVLPESVRHGAVTAGQRGVLQQHAGGRAFDIHIGRHQGQRKRFEEGRRQRPEAAHARDRGAAREPEAQRIQATRSSIVAGLDDLQHFAIELGPHRRVIDQRGLAIRRLDVDPAKRQAPQVGRVNTFIAHQFQYIAVLRKQRDRRHRLARQHGTEKVCDGKTGLVDFLHRGFVAARWLRHKALHGEFHRAKYQCRRSMADHLQRTHGLMQLLACKSQRSRIELGHRARFARETAQRFADAVDRFLDFTQDPGQRSKVFGGRRIAGDMSGGGA